MAAVIRGIYAFTSFSVNAIFGSYETNLNDIKGALKNPQDILKAVHNLQEDNAKLAKQIEALVKDKVKHLKASLAAQIQEVNGIQFLATQVELNPEGAKDLAYELGNLGTNLFLVLATAEEDKPMLTCYISKELVAAKNLNAGQVVRELGKYIQGGGGGQPFFATAGGKNVAPAVLEDRLRANPIISQCVVVGDNKPYIGALITLDQDALPQILAANNIESAPMSDLIQNADVRALVQKAVNAANEAVSNSEAIKKFVILPEDLTIDNGYLTPKMSIRRHLIVQDFAGDIEGLYA